MDLAILSVAFQRMLPLSVSVSIVVYSVKAHMIQTSANCSLNVPSLEELRRVQAAERLDVCKIAGRS